MILSWSRPKTRKNRKNRKNTEGESKGSEVIRSEKPQAFLALVTRPIVARLCVVLLLLCGVGGGAWWLRAATAPAQTPVTQEIPALEVPAAQVEPGSAAPVNAAVIEDSSSQTASRKPDPQTDNSLTNWADRVARKTDVPARALVAYGNAELAMRVSFPRCRLSWATLAGIGRVESNHGRYGGAVLEPNGRPSKPIIGVPLDGSPGIKAVADSDGGRLDGDPTSDHAVGPLQFLPSTWMKYNSDGNGDGVGDPQQIDDAAVGAARYLCSSGRDMASPDGWWSGILSYNNSVDYAQKVFGLADGYATAAR